MKLLPGLLDLVGAVIDHDRLQQHRAVVARRALSSGGRRSGSTASRRPRSSRSRRACRSARSSVAVVLEQHRHAILAGRPRAPARSRRHAARRRSSSSSRGSRSAPAAYTREAAPAGADLQHVILGRELELRADRARASPARPPRASLSATRRPRTSTSSSGPGTARTARCRGRSGPRSARARARACCAPASAPSAAPARAPARTPAAGWSRLATLQRGHARQRDEVVAVPQPVDVGLAEPEAAAQQVAVEARRAHVQLAPTAGCAPTSCPKSSRALALEHDQLAAAHAREQAQREPARERSAARRVDRAGALAVARAGRAEQRRRRVTVLMQRPRARPCALARALTAPCRRVRRRRRRERRARRRSPRSQVAGLAC